MSDSKIVFTPLTNIVYARAFFLTKPDASPLMPGETRLFPMKYSRGYNAATAYRLDWYADQSDADARTDKLSDADRLPTAQFLPATPNTDAGAEVLQDGSVRLTAPESNGYENPVAKIEMVQETTGTTPPYLYLLDDEITLPTVVTENSFRYAVGDPAAIAFKLEWYATRLDADLMIHRLTETERLPRAVFIPETPADDEPETFQDGVLRLYPSTHDMPYTSAVGLLCMVQCPVEKGDPKSQPITPLMPPRRRHVPTWEIR